MRLKSLRKERPAFENEGAVINGSRMDLSTTDLKPTKYRPNSSFALPISLNTELSPRIILSSDQTQEMNTHSRQQISVPNITQASNLQSYQAIEAAYLEHGIRIRVSPTRTRQPSGRKSAPSLQRNTGFVSRNPIRTTSVLHYTTDNLDEHHDSRPFSALQQTSSNDFEQNHKHNVSYAHSSQVNEETHHHTNYFSPSIVASEHSNPRTPEKLPLTNNTTSTRELVDNDPDLVYMSTLLRKTSEDVFQETLCRRAGLRRTFSAHRNPITSSFVQTQTRDKSPQMHRNSLTRVSTTTVLPASSNKIDKDIIKHASRIRRMSPSKDQLKKSSGVDTTQIEISSLKINNNNKHQSNNKSLKSLSLEPLAFLLSPASLSTQNLPSMNKPSKSRKSKSSIKRPTSGKIPLIENQSMPNVFSKEDFISSSILNDESLSLMRTSPLDLGRQSNSFDSGYYDRSSSGGDIQSLASSSIMQIPSSLPSVRLMNSAARRPTSNKRVSFYDEPKAIVVTTATYL